MLITCPDCKKPISELAEVCPHCGRPLGEEERAEGGEEGAETVQQAKRLQPVVVLAIVGAVVLVALLCLSSLRRTAIRAEEPAPVEESAAAMVRPDYQVISDSVRDVPIGTSVDLKILVPADVSKASLDALLKELYSSVAARRGYKCHDAPTAVRITAFTSREREQSDQWIGFLLKTSVAPVPEVTFNEPHFAHRTAAPEAKFSLSEEERKALFKEIVRADDRAWGHIGALGGPPITSQEIKAVQRAMDAGKNRLARKHGLTRQQLDEIAVEGVMKDWLMPPP